VAKRETALQALAQCPRIVNSSAVEARRQAPAHVRFPNTRRPAPRIRTATHDGWIGGCTGMFGNPPRSGTGIRVIDKLVDNHVRARPKRHRRLVEEQDLCLPLRPRRDRRDHPHTTLRASAPAIVEEVRFAADSPLEGAGFEPSVPRQQDLCKHRDRRGSRHRGRRLAGNWSQRPFGAVACSAPLIIRCGSSAKLARFCGRPRARARFDGKRSFSGPLIRLSRDLSPEETA